MEIDLDLKNKCIKIDGELWHLYKKPFPNIPTDFTNKESVDSFIRECAPSVAEWIINNSKPTKESIDVPMADEKILVKDFLDAVDWEYKNHGTSPVSTLDRLKQKLIVQSKYISAIDPYYYDNSESKGAFYTKHPTSSSTEREYGKQKEEEKTISYKELEEATNIFGRSIDILEHFRPKQS